ncbi:MAG: amidohydrolase family protein [Bacteroidota bacterium]
MLATYHTVRKSILLAFLVLSCAACDLENPKEQFESADWIITNGQVITVDKDFSIHQAIAIKDGLVLKTGTSAEISALADDKTKRTNLQGKTIIPGLIDNHIHFVRAAKYWSRMVRWDDVKLRSAAIKRLKKKEASLPKGEWLLVLGGFRFDQFGDDESEFTLAELNQIIPNRPLYIQQDYATAFANSLALTAAGVDNTTKVKGTGDFIKDAKGNLTGKLTFQAMDVIYAAFSEPTPEMWKKSLHQAVDSLLSSGLTTVYDLGGNTVTKDYYKVVANCAAADSLRLRVFYSLNGQNSTMSSPKEIINGLKATRPNLKNLTYSQFGYGETIYAPMRGQPFIVSDEEKQHFQNIVSTAVEYGWQLHEHTMREPKLKLMLDLVDSIAAENLALKEQRFTIAHTNGISPMSIQRAIDMDMVFAVHSVSRLLDNIPTPPVQTIHEMGGIWGLGSDATVVASPNPFHTLGWVVSGINIKGSKNLEDTVTREEALRAHTATNAYILFKENHLGSLEEGKQADFVVLDENYMDIPAQDIAKLRADMTVIEGKIVFQKLNPNSF